MTTNNDSYDNNDEYSVYNQSLLVGERVESGYNQHDVFYQLRHANKMWLIYGHTDPIFVEDPIYEDKYEPWLHVCRCTPNHPKGLDKGWVAIDAEFDDEGAIRETLAKTDQLSVKKEYQHTVIDIYDKVERRTSEG